MGADDEPAGERRVRGACADVCLTMCDGVVVYREGEWPTLDIERAKAEVEARTKRIIGEL